jgi:acyl carrier protein
MEELRRSLKDLICESLHLDDITPDMIEDDTPLFGDGLGLDSVDALELAIEIEKRYGVRITQDEKDRAAFASVASLAEFLKERQGGSVS